MKARFKITNKDTCLWLNRPAELMFCEWALNRKMTREERKIILSQIGFNERRLKYPR